MKPRKTKENKGKTTVTQIDLDKKQVHFDVGSRYGDKVSLKLKSSKASTMKELPSFLGDGGATRIYREFLLSIGRVLWYWTLLTYKHCCPRQ